MTQPLGAQGVAASRRRFLVVVRAGDRSLHPGWIKGGSRNFDLFVSHYGRLPCPFLEQTEYYRPMGSVKWLALHRHMLEEPEIFRSYDAIWFPDDDVDMDGASICRMFDLFVAHGLSLAQPALTHDSYFSHSAVLRDPGYILRHCNFVEVMAPVFSREALALLAPTFVHSGIGWGLDFLWPRLLQRETRGHLMGIIDATPMRHTRPVGRGEIYEGASDIRRESLDSVVRAYPDIDLNCRRCINSFAIFGGITCIGPRSRFIANLLGRLHRIIAKQKSRWKYGRRK